MKIRSGFVSNSSSSSFIVVFPHRPTSAEDIQRMMFGTQQTGLTNTYTGEATNLMPEEIANRVWNGIVSGRVVHGTPRRVLDNMSCSYFDWHMDIPLPEHEQLRKELIALYNEQSKKANKYYSYKHKVDKAGPVAPPVYALPCEKNYKTGLPFTDEEIRATSKHTVEYAEYIKNHKKFQETQKKWYDEDNRLWDKINEISDKISKLLTDAIIKEHNKKYIIIVDYSDNDNEGDMEHGEIFRNLPYIRISHH